jgi:hypothetical protein
VINGGALTHTSVALRDALLGAHIAAVEVHISNIYKREEFRHTSLTAPACAAVITGLGLEGYHAAIRFLLKRVSAPAGEWYVCHTRPRSEKKFAALMAAEGLEHYLPLIASVRRYSSGTKRFTKPLFPGYVFVRVPLGVKPRIYQQDLLARAIAVDDEARFLRQLDDVRAIVSSGVEMTSSRSLTAVGVSA